MSKNYGNDSQIAEIVKYISDTMKIPVLGAGGGFAPIGVGNWYMGSVAPRGWLICDGTIYNIADYPEFAAFIASNYESANAFGGDGITTFAVPDCRGEYFRMIGENSHANQGDGGELGEHQDATEHLSIYGRNTSSPDNWIGVTTNDSSTKVGVNAIESNRDSKVIDTSTLMFSVQTNRGAISSQSELEVYSPYTSRPTTTCWNFIVKATLSDAELNAFNVYTPREHQVAWWEEEIDGVWKRKPVYERTVQFYKNNAPASGWNNSGGRWYYTDFTADFFDLLLDTRILIQDASGNLASDLTLAKSSTFDITWYAAGYFTLNFSTNYNNWFVLTYTKTTDDWQTS